MTIMHYVLCILHYELCIDIIGESKKGRMADALAHGGDEGRDKLR